MRISISMTITPRESFERASTTIWSCTTLIVHMIPLEVKCRQMCIMESHRQKLP